MTAAAGAAGGGATKAPAFISNQAFDASPSARPPGQPTPVKPAVRRAYATF